MEMGNSMIPGRELDALVAEKVMDMDSELLAVCRSYVSLESAYAQACNPLPRYSTDIAAAWLIVEKLDLLTGEYLGKNKHGEWVILDPNWGAPTETPPGTTPAHAICLAALKAVGWEAP